MWILARVCADFYDKKRNLLHRIIPSDRGVYREVPDSIKEDPLFQMLLDDGSIVFVPKDDGAKRALENDPYAGITPDGREKRPSVETETKAEIKPKAESKPKTTAKASVKTEAKAEEKATEKTAEIK